MTKQDMQGQYAGFVSRLTAWLIDRGIILAILGAMAWLTTYLAGIVGLNLTQCHTMGGWQGYVCWAVAAGVALFTLTLPAIYVLFFWTLAGVTPGKAALGIRIVRLDGKPMTFRTSFRRYIGYLVSFLGFGAGFLWMLIDNRRQGWHDKISGTCVVYSWSARQNETLIGRMTNWLFKSRKRVDQYSEKYRGKSIYGTDSEQEVTPEVDSAPNTSSGDG